MAVTSFSMLWAGTPCGSLVGGSGTNARGRLCGVRACVVAAQAEHGEHLRLELAEPDHAALVFLDGLVGGADHSREVGTREPLRLARLLHALGQQASA